ncbi:MAG: acyltransferase [Lachnospiraceae bacterium]|nr:acyltransferase [Lachnospiraceae bacterium]
MSHSKSQANAKRFRYRNISVLRVLACLGVFMCHLVPLMGIGGAEAAGLEALVARVANFGASGVYLFFVISGFLVCDSYEKHKQKPLAYYEGRARRILPQYYLVILYEFLFHTFITHNATPDPLGLRWLRYIFMTSAVIPAPDNFWGNLALTWTIPLFVSFYLFAPLFLRLMRGITPAQPVSSGGQEHAGSSEKRWNKMQGLLSSGFARSLILYICLQIGKYIWLSVGPEGTLSCLYYMHYFVLGMTVWYAVREKRSPAFAICILSIAVVMYLCNGSLDYFTVVSWFFAAVILLTCRISEWNNDESRRSERHVQDKDRTEKMWGAVDTIDHYSYDIYLAHGVVFEALTLIKPRLPFSTLTTGIFMFAAMTALTAFGAVIMHRICERISRRR